jgi:hypothetical protein
MGKVHAWEPREEKFASAFIHCGVQISNIDRGLVEDLG